jgi:HEAT repeat
VNKIFVPSSDISQGEVMKAVESGDPKRISFALVDIAMTSEDGVWVQDLCLTLLNSTNMWVRKSAAICLGHVARRHRKLDLRRVVPALHRTRDSDSEALVRGSADDTLEGINQIWKPQQFP